MNTQPMDQYLNRERLTDLAQFAVPDGHDLWPKIERAARASASGMTTQRPGILSLGLSRAWTAVGILLIAATFAALGFGLAVLVLSNGHDQVPAAQPDATVTPTASPTPSVTEDAQSGQETTADTTTSGTLEALLTSKTLARYRTLPEEYQVALGAYSAFGVSDDLMPVVIAEKMAQWPDNPEPIRDLLDPDRYTEFQELTAIHPQLGDTVRVNRYAIFFLSYYPYVIQTEETSEDRSQAMAVLVDAMAEEFSVGAIPQVPDPELADVIVPSAVEVLDDLGPRLREAIRTRRTDEMVDVQSLAIELLTFEVMLLKIEPGIETPTLAENLSIEDQEVFESLATGIREAAEGRYTRAVLRQMKSFATSPDHPTVSLPEEDVLKDSAKEGFEFARRLAEQQSGTSATTGQTATTPDSWVSENGFIQFTTGDTSLDDLSDDPLPGTHPWCTHPSRIPEKPGGPWLVPSKLPEGMEQTVREQASPQIMLRAFRNATDHISMMQEVCAIRQLSPVSYTAIPIGDRTAYVVAAVKPSADGDTPEFDPNVARSLVMDIGYGVVSFNVFGSVTVDELVSMAASLVPEELSESEQGPYPQVVLDALGTSFGPVYVPGKLPDGYEMLGQLQARQEALGPRTSRLSYVRATDGLCVFHLSQAALRQQFPNVVQRAQRGDETSYTVTDDTGQSIRATAKWGTVEFDGVTLYAQEFSARPRREYADVYFQSQGVWFNMKTNLSPGCDHSLEMVAEIATALEPLQP